MAMTFQCAKCGRSLYAPSKFAGRTIECPGCRQSIEVPELPSNKVSDATLVKLPCPSCSSPLRLSGELHARRIRCNACHTTLTVSADPWKLSVVEGPSRGVPSSAQPETAKPPEIATPPLAAGSTRRPAAASPPPRPPAAVRIPPIPEVDDFEPVVLYPVGSASAPAGTRASPGVELDGLEPVVLYPVGSASAPAGTRAPQGVEPDGLEPVVLQPVSDQNGSTPPTWFLQAARRRKRHRLIATLAGPGLLLVVGLLVAGYFLVSGGAFRGADLFSGTWKLSRAEPEIGVMSASQIVTIQRPGGKYNVRWSVGGRNNECSATRTGDNLVVAWDNPVEWPKDLAGWNRPVGKGTMTFSREGGLLKLTQQFPGAGIMPKLEAWYQQDSTSNSSRKVDRLIQSPW